MKVKNLMKKLKNQEMIIQLVQKKKLKVLMMFHLQLMMWNETCSTT